VWKLAQDMLVGIPYEDGAVARDGAGVAVRDVALANEIAVGGLPSQPAWEGLDGRKWDLR